MECKAAFAKPRKAGQIVNRAGVYDLGKGCFKLFSHAFHESIFKGKAAQMGGLVARRERQLFRQVLLRVLDRFLRILRHMFRFSLGLIRLLIN